MALVPENYSEIVDDVVVAEEELGDGAEPSKTWAIDFERGTIGGFIDDEKALRQFVQKSLMTERSKYVIYTDDYGTELMDLVGDDITPALIDSEIQRMVYETLAFDDRIDDVQTAYEQVGDKLFITATIVPANEDVEITEEVTL